MTNIHVDISESIATLTINRPAVKNALNLETVRECHQALDELAANDAVGVLVDHWCGRNRIRFGR